MKDFFELYDKLNTKKEDTANVDEEIAKGGKDDEDKETTTLTREDIAEITRQEIETLLKEKE